MADFLEYLRRFNRKERFYLIGMALGNVEFSPSPSFCESIGQLLNLPIPRKAFVAMDYHLDWVYASLYLHANDGKTGPHSNLDKLIRAHQEDIDLVIAFEYSGVYHVVLIEAKGDSAWNNEQMRRKAARFKEIFGDDGTSRVGIVPHFVGISPRRPQYLDLTGWPQWMLDRDSMRWLSLRMPNDLVKVTRCTADGKRASVGQYWNVISA